MRKVRPDAKSLQTPPCKIGLSGQFGKVGQSVCLPAQSPVCSHSWSRRSCFTSPHRAGPPHTPSSQLPGCLGDGIPQGSLASWEHFGLITKESSPPPRVAPLPEQPSSQRSPPWESRPSLAPASPLLFFKTCFFLNLPHCHFAELPPPPLKTES